MRIATLYRPPRQRYPQRQRGRGGRSPSKSPPTPTAPAMNALLPSPDAPIPGAWAITNGGSRPSYQLSCRGTRGLHPPGSRRGENHVVAGPGQAAVNRVASRQSTLANQQPEGTRNNSEDRSPLHHPDLLLCPASGSSLFSFFFSPSLSSVQAGWERAAAGGGGVGGLGCYNCREEGHISHQQCRSI
jgi:hypothetical protein